MASKGKDPTNGKAHSRLQQISSQLSGDAAEGGKKLSLMKSTDLSSTTMSASASDTSDRESDNNYSKENPSSSSTSDSDTSQSASSSSRRSRRKKSADEPPADWSDILGQISQLQKMARTPQTMHRGYARQKAAGKLWVRERVDKLFDKGSVAEVGSVSGDVRWKANPPKADGSITEEPVSFTPSNNVQGLARLGGRKCCFTADDYSLRAGHADGALWSKTIYLEKLALSLRLPMIKLVDGSSGGGSVTTIKSTGFSYVPPLTAFDSVVRQLNAGIPNIGAVLGPAIGIGAARVVACHFSVMAGNIGSLFNAGPKVVAGATFEEGLTLGDLGGPDMHCRNGTIDNLASSEEDAFAQMRQVLSYLPNSGASLPPKIETDDPSDRQDEWLRTAIPRRKERMYNPRKIIETVVDKGSFFEIGSLWGTTAIVGLARQGGHAVGVIANNCESNAGALDAAGSAKITKHLKLCDVMNLPLVQFVDIPGYAIGTVAERSATMRRGVELVLAYQTTTTPMFSVVLRRVYGVAGGAMLDCREPPARVAWPAGDWGSLPLQGGIEVGHSAELKKAREDAEQATGSADEAERRAAGDSAFARRYAELERDYTRLMNPVRSANAFSIEEIIDPAVTRPVVCQWVEHIYEDVMPLRLRERASGKIAPQFA